MIDNGIIMNARNINEAKNNLKIVYPDAVITHARLHQKLSDDYNTYKIIWHHKKSKGTTIYGIAPNGEKVMILQSEHKSIFD